MTDLGCRWRSREGGARTTADIEHTSRGQALDQGGHLSEFFLETRSLMPRVGAGTQVGVVVLGGAPLVILLDALVVVHPCPAVFLLANIIRHHGHIDPYSPEYRLV
jgi:hypothetical protein